MSQHARHGHPKDRKHQPPQKRGGPHHIIITRGEKIRSFNCRPRTVLFGTFIAIIGVSAAISAGFFAVWHPSNVAATAAANAAVQSDIRMGYETRIADLSRQIDNLLSRQIVERSNIEQEMAALAERQEQLTERQELLTGLAADAIELGINVLPAAAPLPMGNPLRTGGLEIGPPAMGGPIDPITTGATGGTGGPFNPIDDINTLEAAAARLEADHAAAMATLATAVEDRTRELAQALGNLGYTAGATLANAGGPLVPIDPDHQDVAAIADDIAALADLRDYALSLPLGLPIPSIEVTSGYGPRRDPFLGQSAMHTGVDLVAASGTPVHATGPGTVVIAGVNGGYGNMVEIDHGHGVLTTYAHLSVISVRVGDVVTTDQIVGRSGSTGRSTGPHLHYEITRDGHTIDPLPHIRSAPQIVALLQ